MSDALELVFCQTNTTNQCFELWRCIDVLISKCGLRELYVNYYAEKIEYGRLCDTIMRSGRDSWNVETSTIKCRGIVLRRYGVAFAYIQLKREIDEGVVSIDNLAHVLDIRGFMYARSYTYEYNRWQNSDDVDEYIQAGKEITDLTFVMDPIMKTRKIDVSNNPCRRELAPGMIVSLGARMLMARNRFPISEEEREHLVRLGASLHDCGQGHFIVDLSQLYGNKENDEKMSQVRSILFSQ